MAAIIFTIIFIIYCILAAIAYMPSIKEGPYYYWIGLGFAFVTNSLWLYLSKITTDFRTIHKYSFLWDSIIFLTAALIPIIFFGVRPIGYHLLGIAFIVIGMVLLKL